MEKVRGFIMRCKNEVFLAGTVVTPFRFNHSCYGKDFYLVLVATERASGTLDTVKVLVRKNDVDITKDYTGRGVEVRGSYRSTHERVGNENRLFLSVLAKEFITCETRKALPFDENRIEMDGFVCRKSNLRETPLGRIICDTMVATQRNKEVSYYIPIIAWGRNAKYLSKLPIGSKITIEGRIQSREYQKRKEDGTVETRTYNEVSVCKIEEIKDEG